MLEHEDLTKEIIGCAMTVHRALGPGLLESAYEECLCLELAKRHLPFVRQLPVSISYGDAQILGAYRADVVVDDKVLLELKAVDDLIPIHEAQLLTYLKLGGWRVGFLINFNVALLKNGLRRRIL